MTDVPTWTERLRRELRKQWWQTLTVMIPDGMRLRGSSAGIAEGVAPAVGVKDVASGSWLWLTKGWGTEWSRKIVTPTQGEGQRVPVDPQRDVGRLFDQIVASVRLDQ